MKPKDEKKIEEIFQATLKLVKLNGLAGITMQSIAKQANIATGTLYIYFENKDKLITELFHECVKKSTSTYFTNYDPEAPFKVGFRTIWENMFQYRINNFEESIFIEQCFHSPFIHQETKLAAKEMFQPLVKLIERGKKELLIKSLETFCILGFLAGGMNEIIKRAHYFDKKITKPMLEDTFLLSWDAMKA